MAQQRRAGSDSRCCTRQDPPLIWRDYVDDLHPSVVAMDRWLDGLVPFERFHQEGENAELIEAAAAGELWDSGDETARIKPIYSDPDVYELRRRALTKALRFYHAEPVELPTALVSLHRHIKSDSPSQQSEIDFAVERYRAGAGNGWQPRSSPPNNL